MLLLGLSTTLAMPLDVVWCQGGFGHSALELAGAACCTPANGGGSCATSVAAVEPATAGASLAAGNEACADRWLGAPIAVSPPPTSPPPGPDAMATTRAVPSASCGPDQLRSAQPARPQLRQLRELIATTVLTI